ncbi:MAG: PEP-CTERM sorting domain-containing protein [Armatimonadota bacterium]
MKKLLAVLALTVVIAGAAFAATGPSYSGGLSAADGGLITTGTWADPSNPATLDWTVTYIGGLWDYSYTLSVYGMDVSHAIIEVSPEFTVGDLFNPYLNGTEWTNIGIDNFEPGPGNPNMPGDIYGLKFDATNGTFVTIDFQSDRAPVWGDFYAKDGATDGVFSTLYNSGFTAADPTAPAANGSLDGHLLRPDAVVPEPGTLAGLIVLGGLLPAMRRRR